MGESGVEQSEGFPLVFHHAGSDIPRWARTTLKNAAKSWPGPVYLLSNQPQQSVRGVRFVLIDSWYDPGRFEEFAVHFERPVEFRGGFWFHAIERFFVLSQWSSQFHIPTFLHTELDVRLMAADLILSALPKNKAGIHFPRASLSNAGANVLFVNGLGELEPLLQYFIASDGHLFEMEILAKFLDERGGNGFPLPSHFSLEEPRREALRNMTPLFDVHPIGTWILGFDSRNSNNSPVFNHYYFEGMGSETLAKLTYGFSFRGRYLTVSRADFGTFPVVALHVHSKVMWRAHQNGLLAFYALVANLPWKTVIVGQHWRKFAKQQLRRIADHVYLFLKQMHSAR